jgi:hypothetical protein
VRRTLLDVLPVPPRTSPNLGTGAVHRFDAIHAVLSPVSHLQQRSCPAQVWLKHPLRPARSLVPTCVRMLRVLRVLRVL